MEKDLGKILYEPPRAEIVHLHCRDVIATSGGSEDQDGDYKGPSFSGSGSWT